MLKPPYSQKSETALHLAFRELNHHPKKRIGVMTNHNASTTCRDGIHVGSGYAWKLIMLSPKWRTDATTFTITMAINAPDRRILRFTSGWTSCRRPTFELTRLRKRAKPAVADREQRRVRR